MRIEEHSGFYEFRIKDEYISAELYIRNLVDDMSVLQ